MEEIKNEIDRAIAKLEGDSGMLQEQIKSIIELRERNIKCSASYTQRVENAGIFKKRIEEANTAHERQVVGIINEYCAREQKEGNIVILSDQNEMINLAK